MKLVSAHKQILSIFFSFFILISWNTIQAQEIWNLKQCTDTAQLFNKTLQINRNNMAIGEQKKKEAKANLLPKIMLNGDYKYFTDLPHQLMPLSTFNPMAPEGEFKEAQFGVPHNINANLQLMMPIYNPQVYGAIQNTKVASELTQLQYQKEVEQVLFDVTTLYFNAQILQHQLDFIDGNMDNTQKLLKSMEQLHGQLMIKGTDVNKVKLQSEQLATQRENVFNRYMQILNALKLQMGIALNKDILVEKDIHFQISTELTSRENLDVQLIQTQNKLLNAEYKTLNRSRFLPSFSLVASYGTTGFGYDRKPDEFLKFYTVGFAGLQMTYPLFNGTVTQRKINQKKLELENNELQSQLLNDKNEMETENASRQRIVAQKTVFNSESQIELAQTIYDQTILQQELGTASLTDVLLADNALREAQQNYLTAIIEYLKADLELKKIMGLIID